MQKTLADWLIKTNDSAFPAKDMGYKVLSPEEAEATLPKTAKDAQVR